MASFFSFKSSSRTNNTSTSSSASDFDPLISQRHSGDQFALGDDDDEGGEEEEDGIQTARPSMNTPRQAPTALPSFNDFPMDMLVGSSDRTSRSNDGSNDRPSDGSRAGTPTRYSDTNPTTQEHSFPPVSRIPPRMKSLVQSRFVEFDMDSDELPDLPSHYTSSPKYQRKSRDGPRQELVLDEGEVPLLLENSRGLGLAGMGLMGGGGRRSSSTARGPGEGDEAQEVDDENEDGERERNGEGEEREIRTKVRKGGGMLGGIANMANSILGAGIIGLPYALHSAGFFTGIALLIALSALTDWTIRLIILNAKLSGRKTYIDIMEDCFGEWGRGSCTFFMLIFGFGGMCAFGVIIGDSIPHVLNTAFASYLDSHPGSSLHFFFSRQVVITITTLGISYPLSLYRDIEKLGKASGLALVSMAIIVFTVAIHGPTVGPELRGDPSERWTLIKPGIFEAIGVISFAFVCHHNTLMIFTSLRVPTIDRFTHLVHVSTILSVVASLAMAITGYLNFTDKTKGNVLNCFTGDDSWVNVARFCFGSNMFITLPLENFVCREVIETYWFSERTPTAQHTALPSSPTSPAAPAMRERHSFISSLWKVEARRHVTITTALVFAALAVSLITCNLGVVLELAGGFAASVLAFVFPAACYIRLASRTSLASSLASESHSPFEPSSSSPSTPSQPLPNTNASSTAPNGNVPGPRLDDHERLRMESSTRRRQRVKSRNVTMAWACVVFGVVVMVLSTVGSLRKAFAGGGDDDGSSSC